MQTIQLRVDDKIYDKFLKLLSKFNKEEVEILLPNNNFETTKNYLKKELAEIENGNSTFISLLDFENRLDEIIGKHETSNA